MKNYIITFYDMEDNIIKQFDSYKEAAEYFNTTNKVIQCYISRRKHYPSRKKRDIKRKIWGYLVKDEFKYED